VYVALTLAAAFVTSAAIAAQPEPLVTGLKNPESVTIANDGRVFVTSIGDFDKDGDGAVLILDGKQVKPFVANLNDPKGIVAFGDSLFLTDKNRVVKIALKDGKTTTHVAADAFPAKPQFLNDIAADEKGVLYVSDSGDRKGSGGALFRIDQRGKTKLVADYKSAPKAVKSPNGLLLDSHLHLLVLDLSGELNRLNIENGETENVADGFGRGDGLTWDKFGRLYISDVGGGKVYVRARATDKPVLLAEGLTSAADICYDRENGRILVPDLRGGNVVAIPAQVPGEELDERPLPVTTELAFEDIEWADWEGEKNGLPIALRPIMVTHAGDGSNRVFMATQRGVIHVFSPEHKAKKSTVFLDIQDRVRYEDKENEEGFLGMAFHPNFKTNGEFFVFYTPKRLTNVVCRYRVSKDDPNRADPASEEELLRFERPFWNHDGGTITFGPDGYLYVVHGDGGAANDPYDNAQNLEVLLGKVLRIDVNRRDPSLPYAIPKDNPFVGRKGARGEIWAYGLRNPWRIAFDRETGVLWCGDVGQNLWEEINLLTSGGNYGWNRREGYHAFGPKGTGPRDEYIEPIWEYHHDIGKSITGATVYRGSRVPSLRGYYIYADYVSNKLWGLKYDDAKKRVVANRPIAGPNVPVMSFGDDEQGEMYFMTYTPTGKGIYRFVEANTSQK
jgi:glucose/arabinose dehydrogenase